LENLAVLDEFLAQFIESRKKKGSSFCAFYLFLACEPRDKITVIKDLAKLNRSLYWRFFFSRYIKYSQHSPAVSLRPFMNAEQAWQSVLGQLQMEMPRASFDTWVRDTRAIAYDNGSLVIGVRNAYARDWLES